MNERDVIVNFVLKSSDLHGLGVFHEGAIVWPAGTFVGTLLQGEVCSERDLMRAGDSVESEVIFRVHRLFGVRLPRSRLFYFLNHSSRCNLICLHGHLYARRDIEPGEELTIDYRVVKFSWQDPFNDDATGCEVCGLDDFDDLMLQETIALTLAKN